MDAATATPDLLDEDVDVPDTIPESLTEATVAVMPPPAPEPGPEPDGEKTHTLLEVVERYGQYVALFVGAGLISGSVVHFPLAPVRYAVIGTVGAVVFAIASVLSDRAGKDAAGVARLAISSLALALGIGMISGSIQHFQDIPQRAAELIPIGLALSVAAFVVRNELRVKKDDLAALGLWTVTAVVALVIGLGLIADGMKAPAGGDGATGKKSETAGEKPAESSDDHAHGH